MSSVTLKLTIYGDSYAELVERGEMSLINFLDSEHEKIDNNIQFDLVVTEDLDEDTMTSYVGQFTAKIR